MFSLVHVQFILGRRLQRIAVTCLMFAHLMFGITAPASADERGPHRIRLDFHGAYSLRANDDRDALGFGGALEYEGIIARVVGLGVRYEAVVFPYDTEVYEGSGFGVYQGIGPEVRLHLAPNAARIDPWVAGGARLALTGDLVRFGLQAAVGLDILVGRAISIGPTVSYIHIIQPSGSQAGGADGRALTFGLGLAWGPPNGDGDADGDSEDDNEDDGEDDGSADGSDDDEARGSSAGPDDEIERPELDDGTGPDERDDGTRTIAIERPPVDTDGDGVFDPDDACPNDPAPGGCPPPRPIELRVSDFDFDSAFLNEEQIRQLRLVLDRLRSDRRIRRVHVIGHADQTGVESHNVRLSERRAASVIDWLVSHGVSRRRLVLMGRGSSEPIVRDGTAEQLGTNRRVEFVIVDPPGLTN